MWLLIVVFVLIFVGVTIKWDNTPTPTNESESKSRFRQWCSAFGDGIVHVLRTLLYMAILLIPMWAMISLEEMNRNMHWIRRYNGDTVFVQILNETIDIQESIYKSASMIAFGIVAMTVVLGGLILYRTHRKR